jgi:hypothetical protein
MDGTRLAMALRDRLAEVLPAGFSITSVGSQLWLDTPDGLGNSAWAGAVDEDPTNTDLYCGAVWSVLSSVQDGVTRTLRQVWPLLNDARRYEMAMPGARVVGDTLTLWYGHEDAPVISFRPIKLSE